MRTISADGLEFIKSAEGCKLAAYLDSVGVPTCGFGHTLGVHGGTTCTPDEAETWLQSDLQKVYVCIATFVHVPLNQGQFDALCSFIFNLGCGAFKGSTLLLKINERDFAGAEAEFPRWCHAGKQVLAGLVKRRAAEAEMFSETA